MKTVVITGVSRGIGLATAKKFLDEGWFVIGTSTRGKVDIESPNFKLVALDYLKPESIPATITKIKETKTKIDVLINNAGALFDTDDTTVDISKLRKTLEVNLIGTIDFTERLLPQIQSGGQIINVGSMSAILNQPLDDMDAPAYRISKVAINMYTKHLAKRLGDRAITVSSIDPGWVKTDMGTKEAPRSPEEVAEEMFKLATTAHESGQFWRSGKKRSW